MPSILKGNGRINSFSNKSGVFTGIAVDKRRASARFALSSPLTNNAISVPITITWTQKVWDYLGITTPLPANTLAVPQAGVYMVVLNMSYNDTNHFDDLDLYTGGYATRRRYPTGAASSGIQSQSVVSFGYMNKGESVYAYWDVNDVATTTRSGEVGASLTIWRL